MTNDMEAEFTVIGEPKSKQRPRVVHTAAGTRTYTPQQTVMYENLVKYSYMEQCGGAYLEGAIAAEIDAYFPIPKSESKKRRKLMIDKVILHTKKIDCDNLAKVILDSLNKIAYHDDSQVAFLTVRKFYGEQPEVRVHLQEIDNAT